MKSSSKYLLLIESILLPGACTTVPGGTRGLDEVEVSMHMVLPVESESRYYITGTTDLTNVWEGKTEGFYVYSSADLEKWDRQLAWEPPPGSEWDSRAWGAIILPLEDKYIMIGAVYSSKREEHSILTMEADNPGGPYKLRSEEPLMEGIDPQVVYEKDGSPWLVVGGRDAIMAAPLSNDLMHILAKPETILHASQVPGAEPAADGGWFHDAPVFHRLHNGELLMLFSANFKFPDGISYATFKLRSKTGKLSGPWIPEGVFLPKQHGASFWRRFDGELMLTVKPAGVSIEQGHPEFIHLMETRDDIFLHPDGSTEVTNSKSQGRSMDDFLYIANEEIRLGIDTSMGGAITYLEIKKYGENIVNDFDLGRQIQISFFGGPNPFIPSPDKQPHERWIRIGWNPIQAGDVFGNGSEIKDLFVGQDSIYVSCIPMHWPLDNVPGQCIYESRIKLRGNKVFVSAGIRNNRSDKTQYPARTSELPAVYSNGTYYNLYTYTGEKPFTFDNLRRIPKRNVKPGEFPWSRFQATENWAALVNDQGIGMGVYSPITQRFLGGFTGTEGEGSTFDIPCGYICPIGFSVLDHNIEYDYSYVMVAGTLEEIRRDIYEISKPDREQIPCFDFNSTREGWYFVNARDSGWPVKGAMDINADQASWSLVGPDISVQSDRIKYLEFKASYNGKAKKFSFHWRRIAGQRLTEPESLVVDLTSGGEYRTYTLDLEDRKGFEGLVTGFSFKFYEMEPGDRLVVDRICFR